MLSVALQRDAQSETEPSHHFHSDEHNSIRKQDAEWREGEEDEGQTAMA